LVFISRRKGLQKLLENALEILEKEKEIEVFSILNFRPEGPAPLACFFSPIPKPKGPAALSAREPRYGLAQPKPQAASPPAALPFSSLCVAATPGPLVGVVVVFFLLLVSQSDTVPTRHRRVRPCHGTP
jgi:hypothetical protein